MKFENGVLTTTIPGQYDGQIHSIEWFHNGEWRRIIDTVYPLQDSEVLDDTLDSGGFCFTNELKPYPDEWMTDENGKLILDENGNKVENPNSIKFLKQLAPIRIIWDSEEDYKAVTSEMSDVERKEAEAFNKDLELQIRGKRKVKKPIYRYRIVDEVNIHGEGRLFKFTVKTVEATKLLELVQCDTMTFTRKLGREVKLGLISSGLHYTKLTDYSELFNQGIIKKPNGAANEYYNYRCTLETKSDIRTPIKKGDSFEIPLLKWYCSKIQGASSYAKIRVVLYDETKNTEQNLFTYDVHVNDTEYNKPHPQLCNEAGSFAIRYYNIIWDCYVEIPFSVVEVLETAENVPSYTELTILDVLERILYAGETRREGIEKQRFVLDDSIQEKFAKRHAPEFCITRATMWEALKMVAGHLHCIPRLNWDETTNSYRIVTFDELGQMEECKLKAMHNNKPIAWDVRKSLDNYCGEINTYVDNLVNSRDEAMGCIVEPYAGGWKSARAKDGELVVNGNTAVFNMSRPNMRVSKLEIKYGDKEADITKYLFEAAEYKALSSFIGTYPTSTAYALKYEQGGTEISELNHTSKSIGSFGEVFNTEAMINIIKKEGIDSLESSKFKDIQYRITYSPIISARVVQRKSYIGDCNGYSRNYNVAGNTIESEYLGEHLKGAIARIGNDIEYRTYMFERANDVPKPGMLLDGKYIMKVTTQMSTVRFIKATLILCGDYNQKHEYVAIDSSIRYYDVSEKQSVERHINYSEDVVIGDEVEMSENSPMASVDAVKTFAKIFSGEATNEQVSWAWSKGTTRQYGVYLPVAPKAVLLPCLSQSEGNSLVFNFAFADNYSAGWKINYPLGSSEAVQTQTDYGNVYGEIENFQIELGNKFGIKNYDGYFNDIPSWKGEKPNGLFSSGNNPLIIDKDSREKLNITYQLHCIANRKNIVIGSELCKNNPLVTSKKTEIISCYWLPSLINKFDNYIDVSNGKKTEFLINPIGVDYKSGFTIPPINNNCGKDKVYSIVWVAMDNDSDYAQKNARLILGENYYNGVGNESRRISFSFVTN